MIKLNVSELPIVDKINNNYDNYMVISKTENGSLVNNKLNFNEVEKQTDFLTNSCGIEEFNSEKNYISGDYVTYNKQTYIFTQDHSGSWDENKVIETSAINKIKENELSKNIQEVVVKFYSNDQDINFEDLNSISVTYNNKTLSNQITKVGNVYQASFTIPLDVEYYLLLDLDDDILNNYYCFGRISSRTRNYTYPQVSSDTISLWFCNKIYNNNNITLHYNIPHEDTIYYSDINLGNLINYSTFVFPFNKTTSATTVKENFDFLQLGLELDNNNNVKPQEFIFNNEDTSTAGLIFFPKMTNYRLETISNISPDDSGEDEIDTSLSDANSNIVELYRLCPLDFPNINNYYIEYSREEPNQPIEYIANKTTSSNYQLINAGFDGQYARQQRLCFDLEFSYYTTKNNPNTSIYFFGNNSSSVGVASTNAFLYWSSTYLGSFRSKLGIKTSQQNSDGTSSTNNTYSFQFMGNSENPKIKPGYNYRNTISMYYSGSELKAQYNYINENDPTDTGLYTTSVNSKHDDPLNSNYVYLFGRNSSNPNKNSGVTIRLYSLKFYYFDGSNKVTLRDFIPYSTTYGDGCLYDQEHHKYYFNKGNSKFELGGVVTNNNG